MPLHSVINVNKNLQNPIQADLLNGQEPSGMKVWATPPGKAPQEGEMLAEGKGNMDPVVAGRKPQPCASCRHEDCPSYKYFFLTLL